MGKHLGGLHAELRSCYNEVGSLSEEFAQSASTIWRICQRYRDGDLQAALYDAPRPGRPRVFFQKATQED